MRQIGQAARIPVVGVTLAALTIAIASCGTARQPVPGQAVSGLASAGHPAARRTGGPASGSRSLARQAAVRLLHDLVLPPGSRPAGSRGLPDALRQPAQVPGSSYLVQRHEVLAVPHSAGWLLRYLNRHGPAGLTSTGSGTSSGPSWPSLTFLFWSPRHLPAGLYQADLLASVVPAGPHASLLRADAQVIWYPPRSQAEYIRPGRFAAVRLTATVFNPRWHKVRRVITARAAITRLTESLNALPADPGIVYACPAITVGYQLTFLPAAAGQPAVVAVPDGCNSVSMTVGGRAQPALIGGGTTIALTGRLLGITGPRPGVVRR